MEGWQVSAKARRAGESSRLLPFSVPSLLLSSPTLQKPTERERLVHSKMAKPVTTMLHEHIAPFYSRPTELQCFQMHSKIAPPNSKLRTHKLSVALQTDPRTWKGGFALHIRRSTWIFRLALNLPNSRLLAPGPSHCWVQLGSWTDPHGAVQCTQQLNHPLRLIQAASLDHRMRLGTKMLYFRVYGGLGSAQLSGLEYTLATSLADAGLISFHFF